MNLEVKNSILKKSKSCLKKKIFQLSYYKNSLKEIYLVKKQILSNCLPIKRSKRWINKQKKIYKDKQKRKMLKRKNINNLCLNKEDQGIKVCLEEFQEKFQMIVRLKQSFLVDRKLQNITQTLNLQKRELQKVFLSVMRKRQSTRNSSKNCMKESSLTLFVLKVMKIV